MKYEIGDRVIFKHLPVTQKYYYGGDGQTRAAAKKSTVFTVLHVSSDGKYISVDYEVGWAMHPDNLIKVL